MNDEERIVESEIVLQRPHIRRDRAAVRALLEPDFVEVDHTGRVWDLAGVTETLVGQTGWVQPETSDPVVASIVPGVRLLTYSDGSTYHSSSWVLASPGVWRMRFHHQTSITRP